MEIKMNNENNKNNQNNKNKEMEIREDGLITFSKFKTIQQMNEMIDRGEIPSVPLNSQLHKTTVPPPPPNFNNNQINNYMDKDNPKLVYDKRLFTKYQITPQTYFYIKFGLKWLNWTDSQQSDRLIVTQYNKSDTSIQCHWLKFRMWTFQESNNWKSQCTQLDQYKNFIFNKNKLFKTKIKNLLIDWSFKEKEPDMRLMHVNGILADESIKLFMNLHPNILFYVQDKLRDILQSNM